MYVIHTKQSDNPQKRICYGTINGHDYFFEGDSAGGAHMRMLRKLRELNIPHDEVKWCEPEYYMKNGDISEMHLKAQTTRLTQ